MQAGWRRCRLPRTSGDCGDRCYPLLSGLRRSCDRLRRRRDSRRHPEGKSSEGSQRCHWQDFASCLLAKELDADYLIILTAVEKVAINFGKEDETWLSAISTSEAEKYAGKASSPPALCFPKVEAAIDFASSKPGKKALIRSFSGKVKIEGKTGTVVCNKLLKYRKYPADLSALRPPGILLITGPILAWKTRCLFVYNAKNLNSVRILVLFIKA